jgi:hypothetical protein
MPEITFVPYLEGQPYDAASLNTRFSAVETGLESLRPDIQFGSEGLGSPHLPSLAGYVVNTAQPQTPFLIQVAGDTYTTGPPLTFAANEHPIPGAQSMLNLAEDPPSTWVPGNYPGELAPGITLISDNNYWLPLRAGADGGGSDNTLALCFGDLLSEDDQNHLYLDQPTALAQEEVWAQGLVVLANFQFKNLVRQRADGEGPGDMRPFLGTRFYAAFCIQILTYVDDWEPGVSGVGTENMVWRIVPRTIRFVSEKTLPNAGHTRAPSPSVALNIFKNTAGNDGTTVAPYEWLNEHASEESWIDISIRTVIRKEDLLASGQRVSPETGPLLGVRVAIGQWIVWPGPVQPGSYANDPIPGWDIFSGYGGPPDGLFDVGLPQMSFIRQGNLTVFPLHAGENIKRLIP